MLAAKAGKASSMGSRRRRGFPSKNLPTGEHGARPAPARTVRTVQGLRPRSHNGRIHHDRSTTRVSLWSRRVCGVLCDVSCMPSVSWATSPCRSRWTPPAEGPWQTALLIDLGLLALFALQHSIMARPAFKRVLTRFVSPVIERSTYVLASSLALIVLFWQWRPLGGIVWSVENQIGVALLYAGFAFGWGLVLVTTFVINHFDLFGLRQVWRNLRGPTAARAQVRDAGALPHRASSACTSAGSSRSGARRR